MTPELRTLIYIEVYPENLETVRASLSVCYPGWTPLTRIEERIEGIIPMEIALDAPSGEWTYHDDMFFKMRPGIRKFEKLDAQQWYRAIISKEA